MKVITYIRVSTQEQDKSGLGLEAQKQAIELFCKQHNLEVAESFSESNSGGSLVGRPVMQQVLKLAKKTKLPILTAKVDRAFRNNLDRLNAENEGYVFISVQNGLNPDKTLVAIQSVFSEYERKVIKERTSAALKVKVAMDKANGVDWWGRETLATAQENGRKAQAQNADLFAKKLSITIGAYRDKGMNLSQIARELNNTGVKTAGGKEWTCQTVKRVVARL